MTDTGTTQTETSAAPLAMNRRQFADAVGVTTRTAMRWSRLGIGPKARRLSTGRVRYLADEVRAWLATLPDTVTHPAKPIGVETRGVPA